MFSFKQQIDNLNDKQKDIYNKYLDYYYNNKEKVKNIAKDLNGFEMEEGELFTKCVNSTGKRDSLNVYLIESIQ